MEARRRHLCHKLVPIRLGAFGEPDITRFWWMLDTLGWTAKSCLNPVFAFAIVASIQPNMAQPWKLGWCTINEEDHPNTIHAIGGMYLGFEDEADAVSTVPLPFPP